MKIEPLIYRSEKPTQRTIIDLFAKVNEVIDSLNLLVQGDQLRAGLIEMATTELPISEETVQAAGNALLNHAAESPKPDWVKEEIKEMMWASRQLLWEAFLKGHNAAVPIRKEFNEWVQALPPDTLKEDRELVASLFNVAIWINREPHPAIEFSFADVDHRKEFENALKRLCGMEVGNG